VEANVLRTKGGGRGAGGLILPSCKIPLDWKTRGRERKEGPRFTVWRQNILGKKGRQLSGRLVDADARS